MPGCALSAPTSNFNYPIRDNFCQQATPPVLAVRALREYDVPPKFRPLNFEGVLQVPPIPATWDYFFQFEDEGVNWRTTPTTPSSSSGWRSGARLEDLPEAQRPATMGSGVAVTRLTGT
jgi:hypothetical protein